MSRFLSGGKSGEGLTAEDIDEKITMEVRSKLSSSAERSLLDCIVREDYEGAEILRASGVDMGGMIRGFQAYSAHDAKTGVEVIKYAIGGTPAQRQAAELEFRKEELMRQARREQMIEDLKAPKGKAANELIREKIAEAVDAGDHTKAKKLLETIKNT